MTLYTSQKLRDFVNSPAIKTGLRLLTPAFLSLLTLFTLFGIIGLRSIEVHAAGNILYVDSGGSNNGGSNNCQASATPCATIGHALSQATSNDEIRVAQGTYTEIFTITQSIILKGGYTTGNWNVADPDGNPTVIDGNNVGRVILINNVTGATIEGFIIRNGQTFFDNNTVELESGAGISLRSSTDIIIRDNELHDNDSFNEGGAIYIDSNSQALIEDNEIHGNIATEAGAGISTNSSSVTTIIRSNQMYNNTVIGGFLLFGGAILNGNGDTRIEKNNIHHNNAALGGAILNLGGDPIIQNNIFYANDASQMGGAIYNFNANFTSWHNTLAGNAAATANGGGGIYNDQGTVSISNTIVVSNTANGVPNGIHNNDGGGATTSAAYSAILDGSSGTVNVSNPVSGPADFVNPAAGDYHLNPTSPLIGQGDPDTHITDDVDGEGRPFVALLPAGFDVGADEVYTVGTCFARLNNGGIYNDLQLAVNTANPGDTIKVAGYCTSSANAVLSIDKSVTVSGGYTTTNWTTPTAGPTVLDGQGARRVVYIDGASAITPILEGFRIINGSVNNENGAGILVDGSASPTIQNNFIYDNSISGSGNGGGMAIMAGNPTVQFNTLYNNGLDGIYNDSGNPAIFNNLVINGASGVGIRSNGGSPDVQFNDVFGNPGGELSGVATGNNISVDPDFQDAASNNFHLAVTSPVLGQAGLAGLPPGNDIDGDLRPQGQRSDIGADEATIYADVRLVASETGNADPGSTQVYLHTLTNLGSIEDTFDLTFSNSTPWNVTIQPKTVFTLAANESVNFTVAISVPASATPFEVATTVITATSQTNAQMTATITDVTNVNPTPGAEFTPNYTLNLDPGTLITVTHILTNTGNFTDDYVISLSPTAGSWGRLVLTAPYTVTLPQLGSIAVPVVISVPRTAEFNLTNIFNIVAQRSGPGPALSVMVTDTIIANAIAGDRYIHPSGSDTENNCTVPAQPCATIKKGVETVSAGNTVHVAQGTYPESGIRINKTISLLGGYSNGDFEFNPDSRDINPELTIIDVANAINPNNRGLFVQGVNATIEGFTVQGGNINGRGGGIYVQSASPIIQSVRLLNNHAVTGGGGLAVDSGSPVVKNNILANNSTNTNGGGFFISNGNVTLLNNTIVSNTATTNGGGVYATGSIVRINNTIVASNTAGSNGGGVFRASGPTLVMSYNDFFGNAAPTSPDSNDPLGSNVLAVEPGFDPNRPFTLLSDSPLVDVADPNTNNATDFEGDFRPTGQGFDIGADELAGCLTKNERTGEIFGSVQDAIDDPETLPDDRILIHGHCRGVEPVNIGGQVVSQTAYLDFPLALSGGWNNRFSQQDPIEPAILDAEGLGRTLLITGSIAPLIENLAFINGDASSLGGGPDGQDAGGGIYNYNSNPTFNQITVRDSQAEVGAGFYNQGGDPSFANTGTLEQPNQLISNTATISGGGFYNYLGSPQFSNTSFKFNLASAGGGGLYNRAGQPVLAENQNQIAFNQADRGAGFYNQAGAPTLDSLSIYSNTANLGGGGVYNTSTMPFTASNMLLYGNQANTGHGGGFYNANGSPALWHLTVHNNRAPAGEGGGIYNAGGNPTIGNTILAENSASNGGGLRVAGGAPLLTHNDAFNNAGGDYVGISAGPGSISADPLFENPAASMYKLLPDSPAIDVGTPVLSIVTDFEGTVRPSNQGYDMGAYELGGCKAIRNGDTGTVYGSVQAAVDVANDLDLIQVHGHCRGVHPLTVGLQTFSQTVHLTKSVTLQGGWNEDFSAQNAVTTLDAVGGGHVIFIGAGIFPTIEQFDLIGGVDGAVYNTSTLSPTLRQNKIYSNTGTTGAAIYNAGGNLVVEAGNYIFNNSATNGAVLYMSGGSPRLLNNFIYDNTTTQEGTIYIDGGSPVIWHNTLVGNSATTGSGAYRQSGAPDIRGNIMVDGNGAALQSVDGSSGGGTVGYNNLANNVNGNGNMAGFNNVTTLPDFNVVTLGLQRTYYLERTSAAMDAGDPSMIGDLPVDFEEDIRPSHQGLDIGADEISGCYARVNEDDNRIFGSVQYAVNMPDATIVDVAGTCYGVNNQGGTPQTVYINKTLTLRGGWVYSPTIDLGFLESKRTGVTILDPEGKGRGIFLSGGSTAPVIDRFRIINGDATQADGNGGGIYNNNTNATLRNNVLYQNTATNGAGIYNSGGTSEVWHNTLFDNTATGDGGGIYINGGTITLHNNIFNQNQASSGQAVFFNSGLPDIAYNNAPASEYAFIGPGVGNVPDDPQFVSTDPGNPDFMKLSGGSPVIDVGDPASPVEDDFENQPRPGNQGFDMGADEFAICLAQIASTGQIYGHPQDAVDNSTGGDTINVHGTCQRRPGDGQVVDVLHDLTFRGGWDETFGARDPATFPTFLDGTNGGRAIVVPQNVSVSFADFSLVNGNSSNGGLVYNDGTLTLNTVEMDTSQATNGGAIYNDSNGTLTLTTDDALLLNVIRNTQASGDGGAIYNNGTIATLQNTSIISTSATNNGGGVYNANTATISLATSFFIRDSSATNGGGIYNLGQMPINSPIWVQSSQADTDGGGIYNAGSLNLTNSRLFNNTTVSGNGGGLYSTQPVQMINVYVFNNTAAGNGGGVYYAHSGTATHFHNTTRRNHADGSGGAIYLASGSLVVSNTLIVENSAAVNSAAIHNSGGGSVNVDFTDLYTNTSPGSENTGVTLGSTIYAFDPEFADFISWVLEPTSPAIDKGDPNTHIDFDCCEHLPPYPLPVRPQNDGFDLGRWEERIEYIVDLFASFENPDQDNIAFADPGMTITFTNFISNAGNISDTYDLTIDSSSLGWANPASLTPSVISLAPGDVGLVFFSVTVPLTAASGQEEVTILRARSQTVGTTTDTVTNRTIVNPVYGFEISPNNEGFGAPGDTLIYTHIITNVGNITDTAELFTNSDFSAPNISPITITLAPDETAQITVTITLPGWLAGGIDDINNAIVRSAGDPTIPPFETAAANTTHISFTSGTRHVSINGSDDPNGDGIKSNNCTDPDFSPCGTIAHALSQAQPGDLIKLAGDETFTEVFTITIPSGEGTTDILQVAYIDKSVTLRGGYDQDWNLSLPLSHTTTFQAPPFGRGIHIAGPISATIDGLEITGANFSGDGGAIYNDGATLRVLSNILHDNQANVGAAIYNTNNGLVILQNNFIYNNTNRTLYVDSGQAQVENNTFYSNANPDSAFGVDIWQNSGTLSVTNNIFQDFDGDSAINVSAGTSSIDTNIYFNLINPLAAFVIGSAPTNTLNVDPQLADPGNGDLHLGNSASPAIERGLLIPDISQDIDRQPRPIGGSHDIGADEWLFQPGLIFVPDHVTATTNFNQVITFTHILTNTGEVTDTFNLTYSSSLNWLTTPPPASVTLSGVLTGTKRSEIITITVTTGGPGSGGLTDVTIITATSTINPQIYDTVVNSTTVLQDFGLIFEPDRSSTVAPLDTAVTYTHTLTNTGNGPDIFTFEYSGNPNWPVTLPADLTLGAGSSGTVTITITIPAGSGGMTNTTVITASSVISPAILDTVVDTTTVPITRGLLITPDLALTGQPGQIVTYNHTLTNIGNITDSFTLTLVSSQGWPVLVDPLTVTDLAAAASVPITVTVTIPLTGTASYSGSVDITTISATSVGDPFIQGTAVDTTTVGPAPGVLIAPDNTGTTTSDTVITYTHIITNLGNFSDTFTISASSSQGWAVSYVPSPTIQLTPGQTGTITLTITVPPNSGGLVDTTTITATSVFSPSVFDIATDTTTISQTFGLIFEPDRSSTVAPLDTAVTYTHTLTNTGDGLDTFTFNYSGNPNWPVTLPADLTLGAGSSGTVTITITIPAGSGGVTNTTIITASSVISPAILDTVVDTTTVPITRGLLFEPDWVGSGQPGQVITYHHLLTNTGNITDDFDLAFNSSQGWTITLDPSSPITNLGSGQSVPVTVTVAIPLTGTSSYSGTVDTTVITATSVNSPTIAGNVVDTTIVEPILGVLLEPDNTGATEPNTVITYTHLITNLGNVSDTFTISASSSQGWAVSYVPAPAIQLGPEQTGTITLTITVPANTGGLVDLTTITATSVLSSAVFDVATDTTTISRTFGLIFEPDQTSPVAPDATVVTYTHIITNAGNGPDTFTFDYFGTPNWTVNLPADLTLGAGSSSLVTITIIIPPGSGGLTNVTTITASSTISPAVQDTVVDTTTVPFARGVLIAPNRIGVGQPGQTVTYSHILTNTGNASDSFTLTITSASGWVVSVAPSIATNLAAGQSIVVTATVIVPGSAVAGTVDVATITATSVSSPTLVQDTAIDTTTVDLGPRVLLEPDNSQTTQAGTIVTYTHIITNLGNFTDTFVFETASSQGWAVSPIAPIRLAPSQSGLITLTITVPGNAGGLIDQTIVTATSSLDSSVFDTAVNTTTVTSIYGLAFTPDHTSAINPNVTTVTYTHILTNLGNSLDTYTFVASSSQGWNIQLPPDLTLAPGSSQAVQVILTIPASSGGLTDVTVITATSVTSPTVNAQVVDTTVVNLSTVTIYLPLIMKNYQSSTPPPTPTPTPTATALPPGVDLVVTGIIVEPGVPVAGQPATVYVTVKNQGQVPVAFGNNFWIDFYVDPPATPGFLDFGDLAWSVQGVDFGVGVSKTFSGTITFSGGAHQLYAQADTQNNVVENIENNNVLGPVALTVTGSVKSEPPPAPLLDEKDKPRPTATPRP